MGWFNAANVDPAGLGQSFPLGRHLVIAKSSAVTPTKDNSGGMLVFQLEIIDGPHKGFVGPYRLNLWNSSTQAAEIAGKQLSAICHCTGILDLVAQPPPHGNGQHGQEFFGIPFMIVVETQPGNEKYTQISAVLDRNGNPAVRGQANAAPQPQPAWGGQQQATPAQQQPPAQQPAPAWGGAQQPQQAAQPAWGGPAQPQAQLAAQPAWGGQQQATPAQQQPPAQPAAPGWAQPPQGAAPGWAR